MDIYTIFNTIGAIIACSAVLCIDFCGFRARNSKLWTLRTIKVHKITKPLIWIGTVILTINHIFHFTQLTTHLQIQISLLLAILITNGSFLSFYVSPILLKQEKSSTPDKIISPMLQHRIAISFIVSLSTWSLLIYFLFLK